METDATRLMGDLEPGDAENEAITSVEVALPEVGALFLASGLWLAESHGPVKKVIVLARKLHSVRGFSSTPCC